MIEAREVTYTVTRESMTQYTKYKMKLVSNTNDKALKGAPLEFYR